MLILHSANRDVLKTVLMVTFLKTFTVHANMVYSSSNCFFEKEMYSL